uniref:mannan endo-1,4-beta-mannosidase n=1 Tax=Fusarium oxysporum (strain Fo5176) TaxID=660025 RepID=A0A0D2YB53_FUSOF
MKFPSLKSLMLGLFSVATANAAKSFSASNLYYAAGLTDGQQTTLLNGLQSAGVKVLRVWLYGQSGATKGTPINDFESLQGTSSDDWDDTVLNRLDTFMVKAHDYGINLLISIHSYNALEKNSDFYGKWYGTGDFYTSSKAISQFKDRIAHVLAHKHPKTGKTWAQSSDYIFAFEARNEAMHPQPFVDKAKKAGKKLIMQEWGVCYTDAENNNCNGGSSVPASTRDDNIKKWAANIDAAGIPWFYWQVLPNADPHQGWDYEVGISDANWDALKAAALASGKAESAFDFGPYLL